MPREGRFCWKGRVNGQIHNRLRPITPNMKKRIIAIAVLLSTAAYILPLIIAQADTTTTAATNSAAPLVVAPAPKVLDLRITAYASVPDETDDTPFITANGTFVHDGIVATNLLPFGTQIMIPALFGDKVFIVEDRMAPYFKTSVDIWMPSVEKALFFGVHRAQIVILPMESTLSYTATSTSLSTSILAVATK
jgi:3D (Asp-Asp-Asp) domain-containing protein